MSKKEFDFSDETQLYYEWVLDAFEDALKLLWKRGEHDQEEKDLEEQWKAIQPVLKNAFDKAKRYDVHSKLIENAIRLE